MHRVCGRMGPAMLWALALAWPAGGAERAVNVELSAKQVERCKKVELSIRAETACDNPYDPGEIDVRLELVSPGGKKIVVPAFYFQQYERKQVGKGKEQKEWLYPVDMPFWKARFAPTEVGVYTGLVCLKDRAGEARSAPLRLECLPGPDKGFIRVSGKDPRYLEFEDGSPFFAVGQNVAFVTDSYRTADMIRKLGENGANFARVWACSEDWAMAIEARKSAWGRSWSWNPPIVAEPDREGFHSGRLCLKLGGDAATAVTASPSHPVALRPGTRYRVSGKVRC